MGSSCATSHAGCWCMSSLLGCGCLRLASFQVSWQLPLHMEHYGKTRYHCSRRHATNRPQMPHTEPGRGPLFSPPFPPALEEEVERGLP